MQHAPPRQRSVETNPRQRSGLVFFFPSPNHMEVIGLIEPKCLRKDMSDGGDGDEDGEGEVSN